MSLTSPANVRDIVQLVLSQESPPIVQLGHPALRGRAMEFDGQLSDSELTALLAKMREAMHAAPGVGLAAPQLGIPLRVAVIEDILMPDSETALHRERTPLPYFAVVNPRYTAVGRETSSFFEGCLSFAGWQAVVERATTVRLDWTMPDGTAATQQFAGWPARIIQHETDHLDGVIYIDKASSRSLMSSVEYGERWARPGIEEAQRALGF
ncbi:peptide deformylase [Arthrobacter sp. H5]|uniref:peptide deformylase n=1 Tax=Arthrobacter sp. H5 TaxID=1267973 RepID=UPI00048141F1|nr:peptide deformylase [Arthrobacter sp. H5]